MSDNDSEWGPWEVVREIADLTLSIRKHSSGIFCDWRIVENYADLGLDPAGRAYGTVKWNGRGDLRLIAGVDDWNHLKNYTDLVEIAYNESARLMGDKWEGGE